MRLNLRKPLTDVEWEEVVKEGPGVRMFQGKKTLFWNGEILRRDVHGDPLIYNREERNSWEVIIIFPGVEIIPKWTFCNCWNVKTVIMADTVKRIIYQAFYCCLSLEFVILSRHLEYIGGWAFSGCRSLTSTFVPQSCREIDLWAFAHCEKLIILSIPQHCQLRQGVIADTALLKASTFEPDEEGDYENTQEINAWIKNVNRNEEFALHRACSSFNPLTEIIYGIVQRDGLQSFKKENEIGITPVQYLEDNPFENVDQVAIVKRYILEMMGEIM